MDGCRGLRAGTMECGCRWSSLPKVEFWTVAVGGGLCRATWGRLQNGSSLVLYAFTQPASDDAATTLALLDFPETDVTAQWRMIRMPPVLLLIGQSPSSQPLAPVVMRRVAQPSRIFSSLSWPCHPTIHSICAYLPSKIFCNLTALFSDALGPCFNTKVLQPVFGPLRQTYVAVHGFIFTACDVTRPRIGRSIGRYSAAQRSTTHTPYTTQSSP
ncbi:hypothetical protein CC77DRAFT_119259 [Alternaria alternata]|jgi:hypothetical protein|uniref:Uncharacterized protein n=1 Tax=Alternaria alternata TaxID=5599 RepID=A0A177DM38_ALTAL|nr:hypothetical protein CC77DRAFT_119259 [Alternaria alternata]OAG20300.1 hypothetical protein CC77DRAFT_119259 [Alternaria alternata]